MESMMFQRFLIFLFTMDFLQAQIIPNANTIKLQTCLNYANFLIIYDIILPGELMSNNQSTKFDLEKFDLHASCGESQISSEVVDLKSPSSSSHRLRFEPNGILRIGLNSYDINEYCIERLDSDPSKLYIKTCNQCNSNSSKPDSTGVPSSSPNTICIPKCCANLYNVYDHENLSKQNKKCVVPSHQDLIFSQQSHLYLYQADVLSCFEGYKQGGSEEEMEECLDKNQAKDSNNMKLSYYNGGNELVTKCNKSTYLSSVDERFAVLENGSVILYFEENNELLTLTDGFCLDYEYELFEGNLTSMLLACLPELKIPHPDKVEENVGTSSGTLIINKCKNSALTSSSNLILLPKSIMSTNTDTTFIINQSVSLDCQKTQTKSIIFNQNVINPGKHKTNKYIMPNGILLIDSEYYQLHEYCVESISDTNIILQVCDGSCEPESGITCILKCCHWNEHLIQENEGESKCIPNTNNQIWRPTITSEYNDSSAISTLPAKIHYKVSQPCVGHHLSSVGDLLCNSRPFEISKNGSVFVINKGNKISVEDSYEEFCIDGEFINNKLSAQILMLCFGEEGEQEFVDEQQKQAIERGLSKLYTSMMIISSIFLFLTIIVYALIWDKHNIHGWTVFSYSVSTFFLLISLASSHIMQQNETKETLSGNKGCKIVGMFTHFFFLSTFCWLTTLNFDLWWTFRNLAPGSNKSKGWTRLICYIVACTGVPFLIVMIGFILDIEYEGSKELILPKYGIQSCFLQLKAQGWYLYYLIGLILLFNLGFFGNTVFIMYKYQKSTKSVRKGKSNSQSQSAQLFAKLFIVMGVTWIFEVISWLCKNEKNAHDHIWIPFDLINLIQGVLIFLIFVCKRQILIHLWHKYPRARPLLAPLTKLKFCKFSAMDLESREISGTKITSTMQNSSSLKHYSVNPNSNISMTNIVPSSATSSL